LERDGNTFKILPDSLLNATVQGKKDGENSGKKVDWTARKRNKRLATPFLGTLGP